MSTHDTEPKSHASDSLDEMLLAVPKASVTVDYDDGTTRTLSARSLIKEGIEKFIAQHYIDREAIGSIILDVIGEITHIPDCPCNYRGHMVCVCPMWMVNKNDLKVEQRQRLKQALAPTNPQTEEKT